MLEALFFVKVSICILAKTCSNKLVFTINLALTKASVFLLYISKEDGSILLLNSVLLISMHKIKHCLNLHSSYFSVSQMVVI